MKWKNEDGQSLVEFALVLPIVLLIMCAILDFGWMFTHRLVLTTAVRDGARVGITSTGDGGFQTKVLDTVISEAELFDSARLQVTAAKSGNSVVVTASYELEMLTPMAPLVVGGNTYHLETSCTMRAEK